MKITKEIRDVLINRLLFSLGVLLLIRIGTFLPVPGIEQSYLTYYIQNSSIARFVNTFSIS